MATRKTDDIVYFVFDLLYLNGRDLRQLPLRERRAMLTQLLAEADLPELRISAAFSHDVRDILASADALRLEGVIGKRADAPYTAGKSLDWIKLKCNQRQEFVIGGYTAPPSASEDIRSLLLGVYDAQGRLIYSGSVGLTGKGRHRAADEKTILAARADVSPFVVPPKPEKDRSLHWLEPSLVAEVSFREWSRGNIIRQPNYLGLRVDKPARDVVREVPADVDEALESAPRARRATRTMAAGHPPVTHAERVAFPNATFRCSLSSCTSRLSNRSKTSSDFGRGEIDLRTESAANVRCSTAVKTGAIAAARAKLRVNPRGFVGSYVRSLRSGTRPCVSPYGAQDSGSSTTGVMSAIMPLA